MHILPPSFFHEGYEPSSVELNQEEGVLEISHPSECVLIEECKIVPEILILRCVLRPLPLMDKTIKAHLISEGESLKETLLYDPESVNYGYELEVEKSQWQGVALEYAGIGRGVHQGESFVFYGKDIAIGKIKCGSPLYLKPFKVESNTYQERSTTLVSGQVLISPPGILDSRVLRGYGGYYKEGILLEEIQQVYYALTSTHTQTRIRLFSSSFLHKQHTPPPQGGKDSDQYIIYNPVPQREESLTLPGAVSAGYAHLSIATEWGDIPFSSFLCEPIPGHPTNVNIYFKP